MRSPSARRIPCSGSAPGKLVSVQPVRVRQEEKAGHHFHPESWVAIREDGDRALTGARAGRAIEHRNQRGPGCRGFSQRRRQHSTHRYGEGGWNPAVSKNPCTHVCTAPGPGRSPCRAGPKRRDSRPRCARTAGAAPGSLRICKTVAISRSRPDRGARVHPRHSVPYPAAREDLAQRDRAHPHLTASTRSLSGSSRARDRVGELIASHKPRSIVTDGDVCHCPRSDKFG